MESSKPRLIEQINSRLSSDFTVMGSCASPYIYTSWPAKCKNADGEFIWVDEIPSFVTAGPK
jgi:hypothetical protein